MNSPVDLYQIKRLFGGMVYDGGRRWVGPGPKHSKRDASLSVMLNKDGRAVLHSFAGDPFVACARHLGLDTRAAPMSSADLDRMRRERDAEKRRRAAEAVAFCQSVWSGTEPIEGTPVEAYLWSRGLIHEGPDLRFHPNAPRSKGPDPKPHAAMVALVRDSHGRPTGLHATYLTADGAKAFGVRSRLMFGQCAGGAIRLAPVGADGLLAIAEGIETAGAFSTLQGAPTWAACSTSGLSSFELPLGVRRLIIAADSDDAGAGLTAARALAERGRRRCEVQIASAPVGQDWNDVLRGAPHG